MRNIKKKLELIDQQGVATILCDILQLYTHYTLGVEISFKDARHWVTLLSSKYTKELRKLPKQKVVKQLDVEEEIKKESKTFKGWKEKRKRDTENKINTDGKGKKGTAIP